VRGTLAHWGLLPAGAPHSEIEARLGIKLHKNYERKLYRIGRTNRLKNNYLAIQIEHVPIAAIPYFSLLEKPDPVSSSKLQALTAAAPRLRAIVLAPGVQKMAPRAYWKGYLKLSLVSCPIALYPAASTSEKVSFHRINRKTGKRLKQLLVDSETGDPVAKEDIARGYEVGKRDYIEVEDEELEKIQIESTHTIDIDSFVPREEIDDRYLNSPYYITPNDKVGQEAFSTWADRAKRALKLCEMQMAASRA
jgi:Ku70/Ku80 beta-barrel domain